MRSTHGGNLRALASKAGCAPGEILDFSASINPLGPPDWLREEMSRSVSGLVHYPDPDCRDLASAAARRFNVNEGEVVAGNGSTEILFALVRALRPNRALIPVPAYTDYARACAVAGVEFHAWPLDPDQDFRPDLAALGKHIQPGDAVFLGRPNNPTGRGFSLSELADLASASPAAAIVVDEAFIDFTDRASCIPERPDNVVVLYSLTKIFAVPGLRLGLGFASPELAASLRGLLPPWSVSSPAQAVGIRALEDTGFVEHSRVQVRALARDLASGLGSLPGLAVHPGEANFLLCRLDGRDAGEVADKLIREHKIAVRVCGDFAGLGGGWLRVAVRTGRENQRLIDALGSVLGAKAPGVSLGKRKTPAVMVQGTGSNAGKSVIAAALCRILQQDGLSPAPFKAQNMSLNSFVTLDGCEMGRAQVTQAAACRREPDARMNPVLLKPGSDTGSQVIVMGRPVGNMSVKEYTDYKPTAWKAVTGAYASLSAEAGAMVIEGAGSPAEINLKAHDIVNMKMADHAGAAVLLAGDIDRGGVFAHFTGTMELLPERERDLVAGFVINRFRGDESLLDSALTDITRRTGKPFLGVLPYVHDLGLPEEDSVSFKDALPEAGEAKDRPIRVALIDLPRISNFTDLDALRAEPDVAVQVVRRASDLSEERPPDAVVIPGSKSVAHDLAHLRREGIVDKIKALAGSGEIVGLCGGYQMLGTRILDPEGLESAEASVAGLSLLPIETELAGGKTLTRVEAVFESTGETMHGYEIHHGQTRALDGALPAVTAACGRTIGHASATGRIWGTYLHGAFDADVFRRGFVNRLRGRKGLAPITAPAEFGLDRALDRLAELVRTRLDMARIYQMLGV